ncbi:MAG TPA: hypothetical protein DF383_10255 [Deltaproteobacteria bacterium]|nr:hypothetical protein [Deltaproteobacteria bacterium]
MGKMKKQLGRLLAIGGLDPSGYAGLLADARVWERLGCPYHVAVTALTVQTETSFDRWTEVPIPLFRAQLAAAGKNIVGVKIGMLATPRHAREVLRWVKQARPKKIVWDPVHRSSTGALLLKGKSNHTAFLELLRSADALTPNIPEAEWLLGRRIRNLDQMHTAALDLYALGTKPERFVVLKGGHLSAVKKKAIDLIVWENRVTAFEAARKKGTRRGSGCTFAAALLATWSLGKDPVQAAGFAKRYVLDQLWLRRPNSLGFNRKM